MEKSMHPMADSDPEDGVSREVTIAENPSGAAT